MIVLNETDLFRACLFYQPLTVCVGDEHKGKNYYDMHFLKVKCMRRVMKKLFFKDVEMYAEIDKIGDGAGR